MNYSLTKREKMLLYILLCLVIVVAGWFFLVEPALSNNTKSKGQLLKVQTDLQSVKAKYQEYSDAPLNADREIKDYQSKTEGLYANMSNEDIDKLLTGIVLRNGLIPQSFVIEKASNEKIAEYNPDAKEEEEKQDTESGTGDSVITSTKVSVGVKGSIENIKNLVDEIKGNISLSLQDFNYTQDSVALLEGETIVLNFIVYTINK